jgi:hypothetical protein
VSDLPLRVACNSYDNMQALFDGSVRIDGVAAGFEMPGLVSEIFEQMVRHRAYDVAELGLTSYPRTLDLPGPPFVAIPVFPRRSW